MVNGQLLMVCYPDAAVALISVHGWHLTIDEWHR